MAQQEDPDSGGYRRIAAPARGRRSAVWPKLIHGLVVATLALTTVGANPAGAAGEDVCPEPNDGLQAACSLGIASDALGFISHPRDKDAYRLETHEFGARVRLALPDRPHPYRLTLLSYDGELLRSTESGTIDTTVGLPGTYFAVVDSSTGTSDDGAPYRIELGITYPTGQDPTVLYWEDYAPGGHGRVVTADGEIHELEASDEFSTFGYGEGAFYVRLVAGSNERPAGSVFALEPAEGDEAITADDFTLTIDTRNIEPSDASYIVAFRWVDSDNYLYAIVSLEGGTAKLRKKVNGTRVDLTDWTPVPGLRPVGVNRTTIRCVGNEIRASINGHQFAQVEDDTFGEGLIGFGAGTWGAPTTISFDNILLTTPTLQ